MAKFRNKKVKFDNITFDSQAEYRRYLWLKDEVEQGNIQHLQVHYTYELEPKTRVYNMGKQKMEAVRAIKHEVDFVYMLPNGRTVVEDVKGVATAVWKLKYNLFRRRFPHTDYLVIPAKDC